MAESLAKTAHLIINGKSAQLPEVREAVFALREAGCDVQVRVTWEGGDGARLAHEACREGARRIIAGGGDGSVNEIVTALMELDEAERPALGILPLGSANDFASGIGLPLEPQAALRAALQGTTRAVDVARLGDDCFINMATGGFGAEITTSTPVALKRLLGGGAYSLMGMLKAWRYQPYHGQLRWPEGELETPLFLLAIGNGRQAGGGQALAPAAKLDDGLLDVLIVRHFSSLNEMRQVIAELDRIPEDGEFVRTVRTAELSFRSEEAFPLNLDGEPRRLDAFTARLEPRALRLLMPSDCQLLSSPSRPAEAAPE